jgi:hypothetical protein
VLIPTKVLEAFKHGEMNSLVTKNGIYSAIKINIYVLFTFVELILIAILICNMSHHLLREIKVVAEIVALQYS